MLCHLYFVGWMLCHRGSISLADALHAIVVVLLGGNFAAIIFFSSKIGLAAMVVLGTLLR